MKLSAAATAALSALVAVEAQGVISNNVPTEWLSTTTNWTDYQPRDLDCNLYHTLSVPSARLVMKEVVDPLTATVTFEMIYQGQAWLGIGLSSNDGKMIGSHTVIGRPDLPNSSTNPGKYALNSQVVEGVQLLPSDRQTLLNASIQQNSTHTTMLFTQRLLETNERRILVPPANNSAIYAVGLSNGLEMHEWMGRFDLMLTYCLKPDQDPRMITGAAASSSTGSSGFSRWNSNTYLICMHGLCMGLALSLIYLW